MLSIIPDDYITTPAPSQKSAYISTSGATLASKSINIFEKTHQYIYIYIYIYLNEL